MSRSSEWVRRVSPLLVLGCLASAAAAQPCERAWSKGFEFGQNGVNGIVFTMAVFDEDGPGPKKPALFVGGGFSMAGPVYSPGVARWDGAGWSAVGQNSPWGVRSMAVVPHGTAGNLPPGLYVGGQFADAGGKVVNNVARWDGAAWSALGGGITGTSNGQATNIVALRRYDPDGPGPASPVLVAGGNFSAAGGKQAANLAYWDGTSWNELGGGVHLDPGFLLAMPVWALRAWDEDGSGPKPPALFVGGQFVKAGSKPINGLARWDGAQWTAMGTCCEQYSHGASFAVFDPDGPGPSPEKLIAGGAFTLPGDPTIHYALTWDGSAFGLLGAPGEPIGNFSLSPLTEQPGMNHLYGFGLMNVSLWDNQSWSTVGELFGLPFGVLGLSSQAFDDDHDSGTPDALYIGGSFWGVDGVESYNFARFACVCYADCDGNNSLDIEDYICYQLKFALSDPAADCDKNGKLNIDDFLCFQLKFALGC